MANSLGIAHRTDDLLDFVGEVDPRVVRLSHGVEGSCDWFAEQIHTRYPRIKVLAPKPGEVLEV